MSLLFLDDGSPAAWIRECPVPVEQLITFGPANFDSYARLLYLPDPRTPTESEAEAWGRGRPDSSLNVSARAVRLLIEHSDSSTDLFFALWDGSGHPQFDSPPVLDLVIRSYRIARGTLDDWMTWASRVGSTEPALCWPSDHRWFLASDVDPHWAGVGAAEPVIRALASDSVLHVEVADPTREYPSYGG